MQVLVDNSVSSDAEVARTMLASIPGQLNPLLVLFAREQAQSAWHRSEIECLPTIAEKAREGLIELCIDDVHWEEFARKQGSASNKSFGGNILERVKLIRLKSAINRHTLFQTDPIFAIRDKRQLLVFCDWLIVNADKFAGSTFVDSLPKDQADAFLDSKRFKRICQSLSRKHYDDAFQVWGGERLGVPYFLTTNRNFLNAIRLDAEVGLKCEPILPSELLGKLGLSPSVAMPFEYGRFYYLNGKPCDFPLPSDSLKLR